MKKSIKIIITVLTIVIVISLITSIDALHLGRKTEKTQQLERYEKHYVMIVERLDSDFWQEVYQSAKKAAKKENAYLELLGQNISEEYGLSDYLQIAIAMNVDGILLWPDGSDEVRKLIEQAQMNHIPVITMLHDESGTKRESFVGMNTYQLGQLYAEQIRKLLKKGTTKIQVLYDLKQNSLENGMVYNQIKNELKANLSGRKKVQIEAHNIVDGSAFETEKEIRDIFVSGQEIPDIFVCMDEMETEYLYQALVDYNYVGKAALIGYYHSENILRAIQKGNVAVTLEPDAGEVGKKSIESLTEYYDAGYVSEYYSVDCDIISKENVEAYLKELKKEE